MDQWKREAIRMLQETEFGKTTVKFDKHGNPYETHRCFECNGLGYHKTGCKLFKILSSPPELNFILMKLYDTFGTNSFSLGQAADKLETHKDTIRDQLDDLAVYDCIDKFSISKDEVYMITTKLITDEEFIENLGEREED